LQLAAAEERGVIHFFEILSYSAEISGVLQAGSCRKCQNNKGGITEQELMGRGFARAPGFHLGTPREEGFAEQLEDSRIRGKKRDC